MSSWQEDFEWFKSERISNTMTGAIYTSDISSGPSKSSFVTMKLNRVGGASDQFRVGLSPAGKQDSITQIRFFVSKYVGLYIRRKRERICVSQLGCMVLRSLTKKKRRGLSQKQMSRVLRGANFWIPSWMRINKDDSQMRFWRADVTGYDIA